MKKLMYLFAFGLFAVATSMCDSDNKYPAFGDNENYAMLIQKENQPSPEAKCDNCSEETAWAASAPGVGRYNNTRGNWATYICYSEGVQLYNIYAGQYMYAGYIEISEVDATHVHFYLILFDVPGKDPWCFQDVEEPVKIRGYSSAPSGNPKIGLFPYKPMPIFIRTSSEGPRYDLGVWERHNFYGIHLDLGCCD